VTKYGGNVLFSVLEAEVPEGFFHSVIRSFWAAYEVAHNLAFANHAPPEAHDLLPYLRRAKIEESLRDVASRSGLLNTYEKNEGKNAWYTQVRTSNCVFTASSVEGPQQMVRSAIFRETLAASAQLSLFSSNEEKGKAFYGILLHGPDVLEPSRPAFIRLGFPSKDCKAWVENIDLYTYCNFDTKQLLTNITEECVEMVSPVLLPSVNVRKKA
jgi:hypothetical protein